MTAPFIVIAGPTACKKTETAVAAAALIGGEIISADSMQVYKYMDIGTAKPSAEEMRGIKHYLIDELYPDEEYSAYIFQKKAFEYMSKIREKGKIPVICGGTGFYINTLLRGNSFAEAAADDDFSYRNELYELANKKGDGFLHALLAETDPEAAAQIHENNIKRVVRALEFYKQTGKKISEHNIAERAKPQTDAAVFFLAADRQIMYERINARVDKMVSAGLENEVKGLLEMGYGRGLTSMQGIGYKEIVDYIEGVCTLEAAVEKIKTGTRHYAKRQLTWFSRQCEGTWLDAASPGGADELAGKIVKCAGY